MPSAHELRDRMVTDQLVHRGISDPRVLGAMREVPRHLFVHRVELADAYGDHPLPIGHGQTISQPYMVARMTELLAPQPSQRILEIGAGSGYQTAVLASLCARVYAMERVALLAESAQQRLHDLGIGNVTWRVGDGTLGWPEEAPFDGILVAAGAPDVPQPYVESLTEGGRLVIPVGKRHFQELQIITNHQGEPKVTRDIACRFVDLIGKHGW